MRINGTIWKAMIITLTILVIGTTAMYWMTTNKAWEYVALLASVVILGLWPSDDTSPLDLHQNINANNKYKNGQDKPDNDVRITDKQASCSQPRYSQKNNKESLFLPLVPLRIWHFFLLPFHRHILSAFKRVCNKRY